MKIEEMVLSIEQMEHLNELGLKVKDTALCWVDNGGTGEFRVMPNIGCECFEMLRHVRELKKGTVINPTLTLQEIWQLLPKEINNGEFMYELVLEDCQVSYYQWESGDIKDFHGKNIIDEAYKMLCWVLENGYLKQDK